MATETPPDPVHRSKSRRKLPSFHSSATSCTIPYNSSKQVFLHDWWLIKAESGYGDKRLGIGGLYSRENKEAIRCFLSAPVVKRWDTVTLETIDGFTVMFHGLLNRSCTIENGFDSEVCDQFEIGFPFDWEDYAVLPSDEKPDIASGSDAFKTSTSQNHVSPSRNQISVERSGPLTRSRTRTS